MIDQQDIEKGAFAASLEERVALLAAGERLAGIGSWRWQIDHDVITCSPGWLDIYGCRVAPCSIAELRKLVHPDDRERVDGAMLALLAGESPYALEFSIVRSDAGDLRRLCASAEVARDVNGKPVEVIGCVRDIGTARSEQQSAGQTGQEDAGDAAANAESAARNTLLANISHQIRTSITAILGIAEMLKADILIPRHVERLNTITDAVQDLLSVINEWLEPAQVEFGKLVLAEGAVDLARILDSVIKMNADQAAEKGLQLLQACDDIPLPLLGDPTRIRHALLACVSSAMEHTRCGIVAVRVRREQEDSDAVVIRFEVAADRSSASEVEAPSEHGEPVDQAFRSANADTHWQLAMVTEIAEAMSGSTGFQEVPGSGSAFWFTARLKKAVGKRTAARRQVERPLAAVSDRRQNPSRILVVDDEWINRKVILEMLDTVGLVADYASDGQEAVELAARTSYALILMDLQMPTMDGFEAARRIRRRPEHAHVPILALTGHAGQGIEERCRQAGMNDFMGKPFSMHALLDVVARSLRSSASV